MRKVILVLASLVLLISTGVVALGCAEETDAEVTWDLATYSLPGSLQTDTLEHFAELVKDMSDGRMEVNVYPGGTRYTTDQEIYNAVTKGEIDIGACPAISYSQIMPNTAMIFGQSWSADSRDMREYLYIKKRLVEEIDVIKQESASQNVMHFLWLSAGSAEFMYDGTVTSATDMEGMVLSCPPGIGLYVCQAFKATPKEEQVSDIIISAQAGSIDGRILLPLGDYVDLQLYEYLPYVVLTDHAAMISYSSLLNIDSYSALDADLQQIVMDAAEEAEESGLQAEEAAYDSDVEFLQTLSDVNVYTLSDQERQGFVNVISGVAMQFMNQIVDPDVVVEVMTLVEQAKSEYAAAS